MDRRDAYQEMLGVIGQYFDIPEIDFDEEGLCFLDIDTDENYKHVLVVRRDDQHCRIVLMVELADNLAESQGGMFKAALAFNFMQTDEPMPSMGMDDEKGSLFLFQIFPLSDYSEGKMLEKIGSFFSWFDDCLRGGAPMGTSEHQEDGDSSETRMNPLRFA